jgi:hypothetical protein
MSIPIIDQRSKNMNILTIKMVTVLRDKQKQNCDFLENGSNNFD